MAGSDWSSEAGSAELHLAVRFLAVVDELTGKTARAWMRQVSGVF